MRSGGVGVGGLMVIVGVLYFTDYGTVALTHMQRFEQQCYGLASTVGHTVADPLCQGVSYAVNGITKISHTIGEAINGFTSKVKDGLPDGSMLDGMGGFGGDFRGRITSLTSSSERLNQIMMEGPSRLGGSSLQQFQQAIDSYSIGQHYLTNSGNAANAMPWLMQGARQPDGFGLLSQLSLGDVYRQGAGGVPADPVRAELYYGQAIRSLGQLSRNDSPQSQQLLGVLPASPQMIQQQLLQVIAQLKQQR